MTRFVDGSLKTSSVLCQPGLGLSLSPCRRTKRLMKKQTMTTTMMKRMTMPTVRAS